MYFLYFAEYACVVPFFYYAPPVVCVALVAHLGDKAALCCYFPEFARLPYCADEGLLAEYVLAGFERPCGYRKVHVVGGGDCNAVDFLVHLVEHAAEIPKFWRVGIFFCSSRNSCVVNVAQRANSRLRAFF